MFKTITTLAAAALLAGAASAAPTQPPTREVRYGDLDLASAAGRAALDTRIRVAVNSVCGERVAFDPREARRIRMCRKATGEAARHNAELAVVRHRQMTAERLAAR